MLDIPKIQSVLRRASHWDLYGSSFGGAYVHGHLFRPVVDLEELELWEELIGFTLPEDYRCYLTRLGNGGAGPNYGIFPFDFSLQDEYREQTVYALGQEERFHNLSKRRYEFELRNIDALYEEYCSRTPKEEQMSYSQFDDTLWETEEKPVHEVLYEHGILCIANAGCSADIGLLLNGSHRGCVGGISCENCFHTLAPEFSLSQELEFWKSFESYFMKYVQRMQEFYEALPVEKKRQALREREIVLPFQAAIEQEDWKEILHLLQMIHTEELSEKTTFFLKYHRITLERNLPEEPSITALYQEIEKNRHWNYERYHGFYVPEKHRVLRDGYDAHFSYAVPTFQQFFQTYVDMEEDVH